MYLSRLWPNLRHYYTRRQMGLPYELHRTLARAFPEKEHGGMGRVLFRVEQMKDRAQTVLVLSELQPDWRPERFVHQGVVIWEAETKSGQYDPTFSKGDICAFRLLANPTVKREGKRLAWLREEDQRLWLQRKGEQHGFTLWEDALRLTPMGFTHGTKEANQVKHAMVHYGLRYDGVLQISDPRLLTQAVSHGIGSAKGMGFGLLSVLPLRRQGSANAH